MHRPARTPRRPRTRARTRNAAADADVEELAVLQRQVGPLEQRRSSRFQNRISPKRFSVARRAPRGIAKRSRAARLRARASPVSTRRAARCGARACVPPGVAQEEPDGEERHAADEQREQRSCRGCSRRRSRGASCEPALGFTSADDASPGIRTVRSSSRARRASHGSRTVSPGRAAVKYVSRHVRLSCSAIARRRRRGRRRARAVVRAAGRGRELAAAAAGENSSPSIPIG